MKQFAVHAIIAAGCLSALSATVAAQEPSPSAKADNPAIFTFVYPLSTAKSHSEERTYGLSLSFLYGVIGGIRGAELSGAANVNLGNVTGAQVSGIMNYCRGEAESRNEVLPVPYTLYSNDKGSATVDAWVGVNLGLSVEL